MNVRVCVCERESVCICAPYVVCMLKVDPTTPYGIIGMGGKDLHVFVSHGVKLVWESKPKTSAFKAACSPSLNRSVPNLFSEIQYTQDFAGKTLLTEEYGFLLSLLKVRRQSTFHTS